jgi:hypothetical protein
VQIVQDEPEQLVANLGGPGHPQHRVVAHGVTVAPTADTAPSSI